jgi:hypothetical protein
MLKLLSFTQKINLNIIGESSNVLKIDEFKTEIKHFLSYFNFEKDCGAI